LRYLRDCDNPTPSEVDGVRECISKATRADWWDWGGGSRIFFWRWPSAHRESMRKGHPVWVKGDLPKCKRPQPAEKDPSVRDMVRTKLSNVRDKGYIKPGRVVSLTGYFAVPKGVADIRMVYDASRSGLNEALWSPNFGLPTIESLLRGVTFDTWMGDIDLSEMFLNFCLDESLHEFCGVDVGPYFKRKGQKTKWERWVRCLMGLKISPYVTIKGLLLGLEWVIGDITDKNNVFHWSRVRLNLPGDSSYDPRIPWVSKVKKVKGQWLLAALLVSYVDDLRVAGASEDLCWQVMHHISSRLSFLASRSQREKRDPPVSPLAHGLDQL